MSNPETYFQSKIYLYNNKTKYFRFSYTIQDLMADIGGFAKSLIAIICFLLDPISKFLFYINTTQKIFQKGEENQNHNQGKKSNDYFKNKKNIPEGLKEDEKFMKKVDTYNPVRFGMAEKVKILLVKLYIQICICKKIKKTN